MQVLCIRVAEPQPCSVRCAVCGQEFAVYYSRHAEAECAEARETVFAVLLEHHAAAGASAEAHAQEMFNVPAWHGLPQYSGAAMLSGAPCARPRPKAMPNQRNMRIAPSSTGERRVS